MKLVRALFLALAVLLPVSGTVARAADEAPAEFKKEKKTKKKAEKPPAEEKKAE